MRCSPEPPSGLITRRASQAQFGRNAGPSSLSLIGLSRRPKDCSCDRKGSRAVTCLTSRASVA
eukprot:2305524-Alexandrium_andersonii.AAC.1